MLQWIGTMRICQRSPGRVVLRLSRATRLAGFALAAVGLLLTLYAYPVWHWLALLPAAITGVGVVMASLQREMIVDREAGVLEVEQRFLGLTSRAVVPLFHLRAVVVTARPAGESLGTRPRYVAYVDRRVGEAIYLDEARRCAQLLKMAETIADVAELRLEYEAVSIDR